MQVAHPWPQLQVTGRSGVQGSSSVSQATGFLKEPEQGVKSLNCWGSKATGPVCNSAVFPPLVGPFGAECNPTAPRLKLGGNSPSGEQAQKTAALRRAAKWQWCEEAQGEYLGLPDLAGRWLPWVRGQQLPAMAGSGGSPKCSCRAWLQSSDLMSFDSFPSD